MGEREVPHKWTHTKRLYALPILTKAEDGKNEQNRMDKTISPDNRQQIMGRQAVCKVKSFLDNLKKVGMIDFNCTSKCTTIFLVNYAKFAAKSNANAPQNAYQMHNTCTVDAQQMHTHKNIKNIKEDKENKEEKSLEIPCWLDVGNDYESLSAEDKKMRIICRKMDKLDELKRLAAEYGIPPDEADSLARECMEEHGAKLDGLTVVSM